MSVVKTWWVAGAFRSWRNLEIYVPGIRLMPVDFDKVDGSVGFLAVYETEEEARAATVSGQVFKIEEVSNED